MDDLIRKLIEGHRPEVQRDAFSFGAISLVRCRVCDGDEWHLWQMGEQAIECEIWKENSYRIEKPHDESAKPNGQPFLAGDHKVRQYLDGAGSHEQDQSE